MDERSNEAGDIPPHFFASFFSRLKAFACAELFFCFILARIKNIAVFHFYGYRSRAEARQGTD
jgi:hypothetical protein